MASLIEFDKHEDSNEVHVGGVKLEVDVGWAEVITGRHNSLHNQGKAHSIE